MVWNYQNADCSLRNKFICVIGTLSFPVQNWVCLLTVAVFVGVVVRQQVRVSDRGVGRRRRRRHVRVTSGLGRRRRPWLGEVEVEVKVAAGQRGLGRRRGDDLGAQKAPDAGCGGHVERWLEVGVLGQRVGAVTKQQLHELSMDNDNTLYTHTAL